MTKKLKRILLIGLALLLCAASFVACDSNAPNPPDDVTVGNETDKPEDEGHIHSFSSWTVTQNPTCTQNGKEERSCSCGQTESRNVSAVGHDYVNGTCSMCGLNQGSSEDLEDTTENTPEPPPAPESANLDSEKTEVYDGITVTQLPYYAGGILVNSISFSNTKVTVNVTNHTGHAIKSISSIAYKCYDGNETILSTGDLYLEDLNNGESADVYFYAEEGTCKILFDEVTIYEGVESGNGENEVQDGITINKLPYEVDGLRITAIAFSGTKVTVTVTNNTGHAIKGISSIAYKCYNDSNTIVTTGDLYLEDMNNGETAKVYFYTEEGTREIQFGAATIYEGTEAVSGETHTYDGITVTKLPYEVDGLKVTSIAFERTKVTVSVTNNTGHAIKSISSIAYKCYDSDGIILGSEDLYLEDLNNGESAEVYFYAEEGTSKILFHEATIYEGEATDGGETDVYDGITVTKLPYKVDGLTITSIAFQGTKVTVTVTNNTGHAIKSISSIAYKCFGTNGQILQTGDLYLEDMNNGETAEAYFYAEEGTSKITFGAATVYKADASGSNETDVYDGITVNKLPYDADGIIITSISFSGTKVTVTVTNNTGHTIKSISSIAYKCYGLDGNILATGDLYLEDMNPGEVAEVYFYAEEGTSKILFDTATIYKS